MISYCDGQLTDIMPGNITQKPEAKALSHALQQACRLLYRYSQRLYVYSNLDGQPEEVIDLLAAELRTQHYRGALDLDMKRRLVKNTLIWHMGAGTPQAVEELVETVFGEGEVKEWHEYNDEPYYFKISTNAKLTAEMNEVFSNMIRRVKNARSHLRALDIRRAVGSEAFSGAAIFPNCKPPAIMDGYRIGRKLGHAVCAGASTSQQIRPAPGMAFRRRAEKLQPECLRGRQGWRAHTGHSYGKALQSLMNGARRFIKEPRQRQGRPWKTAAACVGTESRAGP